MSLPVVNLAVPFGTSGNKLLIIKHFYGLLWSWCFPQIGVFQRKKHYDKENVCVCASIIDQFCGLAGRDT